MKIRDLMFAYIKDKVAMNYIVVEEATLTPIVRHILESSTVKIESWQVKPVSHHVVNLITAGLQRISGVACDRIS